MDKVVAAWKKLYATTLFYRFFWTFIQVGTGYIAAVKFDNPQLGVAVTLLTTVVTSIARESLAKRRA